MPITRTVRSAVVGVLACGALAAGSIAANAASSTSIDDLRADVWAPGVTEAPLDEAASVASGIDVTQLRAVHSKSAVYITAQFAELSTNSVRLTALIQTRYGPSFGLTAGSTTNQVHASVTGKKVCSVSTKVTTGVNGTIRVVVPRACLGYPRQVRLADMTALRLKTAGSFWSDAISSRYAADYAYTTWLSTTA